ALKLAKEIAARAPIAIRLGKEMVNHAFQAFLTNAIADERGIFYSIFSSEDQKEGMRAFVEKRPADWKGK
ncbi:MAG: enoyl-CoA hydratase-related protein, partial [Chloroflexota bacterium]